MFQNVSIQNKFDSEKAGLQKITVLDKNIISDWHGGGGNYTWRLFYFCASFLGLNSKLLAQ